MASLLDDEQLFMKGVKELLEFDDPNENRFSVAEQKRLALLPCYVKMHKRNLYLKCERSARKIFEARGKQFSPTKNMKYVMKHYKRYAKSYNGKYRKCEECYQNERKPYERRVRLVEYEIYLALLELKETESEMSLSIQMEARNATQPQSQPSLGQRIESERTANDEHHEQQTGIQYELAENPASQSTSNRQPTGYCTEIGAELEIDEYHEQDQSDTVSEIMQTLSQTVLPHPIQNCEQQAEAENQSPHIVESEPFSCNIDYTQVLNPESQTMGENENSREVSPQNTSSRRILYHENLSEVESNPENLYIGELFNSQGSYNAFEKNISGTSTQKLTSAM